MQNKFDVGGILVSIGCIIHCLALPLLTNTFNFFAINIIHNAWIDVLLFCLSIYLGTSTLIPSYKNIHRKKLPLILFLIGIVMLGIKEFIGDFEYYFLWTGISLSCIISSHIFNMRYAMQCSNKKNIQEKLHNTKVE